MKKVLMILIASVLLLSMSCGTVLADTEFTQDSFNVTNGYSNETSATVTLSLENLFTVTIPTDFIFNLNKDGAFVASDDIILDVTRIEANQLVNITVSSGNYSSVDNPNKYWNLTSTGGETPKKVVNYQMKVGTSSTDHIVDSTVVAHLSASSDVILSSSRDKTAWLHLKVVGDPEITGSYMDILSFGVKLITIDDND